MSRRRRPHPARRARRITGTAALGAYAGTLVFIGWSQRASETAATPPDPAPAPGSELTGVERLDLHATATLRSTPLVAVPATTTTAPPAKIPVPPPPPSAPVTTTVAPRPTTTTAPPPTATAAPAATTTTAAPPVATTAPPPPPTTIPPPATIPTSGS